MFHVLEGGLDVVSGFSSLGIHCGIKKDKNDLAVILSEVPAVAAGMFTRNEVKAAPVLVTKRHLEKNGLLQLIVVNSGVANACTGKKGEEDAEWVAERAALYFGLRDPSLVAVASTGVIGEFLPLEKIDRGLQHLASLLPGQKSSRETARAIMTTDTFPKERAVVLSLGERSVRLAGIAKGAGMIRPNLATMLSFLITDASIRREDLELMLREAVDRSFHHVTVDGDTSTNDMVLLLANGASGVMLADEASIRLFREALFFVCEELAKDLARDGEGATKFVTVRVEGARSEEEARLCAFTVAESPLVKTALFGEDPNWGRIMAALGRSGVPLDPERISITLNDVLCVRHGMRAQDTSREMLKKAMEKREIAICIDLGLGHASFEVWTCDFSLEYVRINSHYT
ncbi:MAG: bifunctional glutamate N-acetyltransferase/amino-acid acetyltransferase ArgJ [Atribacterota bacterium]